MWNSLLMWNVKVKNLLWRMKKKPKRQERLKKTVLRQDRLELNWEEEIHLKLLQIPAAFKKYPSIWILLSKGMSQGKILTIKSITKSLKKKWKTNPQNLVILSVSHNSSQILMSIINLSLLQKNHLYLK